MIPLFVDFYHSFFFYNTNLKIKRSISNSLLLSSLTINNMFKLKKLEKSLFIHFQPKNIHLMVIILLIL